MELSTIVLSITIANLKNFGKLQRCTDRLILEVALDNRKTNQAMHPKHDRIWKLKQYHPELETLYTDQSSNLRIRSDNELNQTWTPSNIMSSFSQEAIVLVYWWISTSMKGRHSIFHAVGRYFFYHLVICPCPFVFTLFSVHSLVACILHFLFISAVSSNLYVLTVSCFVSDV